jgi:hypothetical protein
MFIVYIIIHIIIHKYINTYKYIMEQKANAVSPMLVFANNTQKMITSLRDAITQLTSPYENKSLISGDVIYKKKIEERTLILEKLSNFNNQFGELLKFTVNKITDLQKIHSEDIENITKFIIIKNPTSVNYDHLNNNLTTPIIVPYQNITSSINNIRDMETINTAAAPMTMPITPATTSVITTTATTSATTSTVAPKNNKNKTNIVVSSAVTPITTTFAAAVAKNLPPTNDTATVIAPIYITNKYYIDATMIGSIADATENGKIYYIKERNLFVTMLANVRICGNIGNVYFNEKTPEKIKDCSFGAECTKEDCKYFHNPSTMESTDVRNFIASSWINWSDSSNNVRRKRFGSRDSIAEDLPVITKSEKQFFGEQVMHEILCYILLEKAKI